MAMQKILKSLLALVFFTLIISACEPQADISTSLDNEATRNEIYGAIVADYEYPRELAAIMMEEDAQRRHDRQGNFDRKQRKDGNETILITTDKLKL